jgi:hypothetical protein
VIGEGGAPASPAAAPTERFVDLQYFGCHSANLRFTRDRFFHARI